MSENVTEILSKLNLPYINGEEDCNIFNFMTARGPLRNCDRTCQYTDDVIRMEMEKELIWTIINKVKRTNLSMDDPIAFTLKRSVYKGYKENANSKLDFVKAKSRHIYCVKYADERICDFVFMLGYSRYKNNEIQDNFTMEFIKTHSLIQLRGDNSVPFFYRYTVPAQLKTFDFYATRTVFTKYVAKKVIKIIRRKIKEEKAAAARIEKQTSDAEIKKMQKFIDAVF